MSRRSRPSLPRAGRPRAARPPWTSPHDGRVYAPVEKAPLELAVGVLEQRVLGYLRAADGPVTCAEVAAATGLSAHAAARSLGVLRFQRPPLVELTRVYRKSVWRVV